MSADKTKAELFEMLIQYFLKDLDAYTITGEVVKVDKANKVCSVKPYNNDPLINNVRFAIQPNSAQGLVRFPKIGSQVAVGMLEFKGMDFAQLLDMQEFDEWIFDNGGSSIAQATKTASRLAALEKKVDDLIDANDTHTHADPSSGTTGTPSTASLILKLNYETEEGDINYDKIKIP